MLNLLEPLLILRISKLSELGFLGLLDYDRVLILKGHILISNYNGNSRPTMQISCILISFPRISRADHF